MLICPNKDFDDPNTRPRLWWVGYLDPQRLQQQSDSAAAPAGSAAFYDAGAEVIRYVLGRRTLDALQGWTITGAPGSTSMSRSMTTDELSALAESGLVQSDSEDGVDEWRQCLQQ